MTIMAKCDRCGFVFPSVAAGGSLMGSVGVFADNIESCRRPGCGGMATSETIVDGVKYGIPSLADVLGRLRAAAPGELTDFAEVVRAVHTGAITANEGRRRAAEIRPEFAVTLDWAAISGLVALLALIVSLIGLAHDFAGDADAAKAQTTNEGILAAAREHLSIEQARLKIDEAQLAVNLARLQEERAARAEATDSRQVERARARAAAKRGKLKPR